MQSRNVGYLVQALTNILNDAQRDKNIQKYLCYVLLARFDDIQRDYKFLKNYKHLENVEKFLACVFNIQEYRMQTILKKLQNFKNINNQNCKSCMDIKL